MGSAHPVPARRGGRGVLPACQTLQPFVLDRLDDRRRILEARVQEMLEVGPDLGRVAFASRDLVDISGGHHPLPPTDRPPRRPSCRPPPLPGPLPLAVTP